MSKSVKGHEARNVLLTKHEDVFEGHVDPFLRLSDAERELLFRVDQAQLLTRCSVPNIKSVLVETVV